MHFNRQPGVADAAVELVERFNVSITKGFALVIGQPDTRMAEAIASRTQLHVISVLRDKAKVEAERRRLLSTTDLYGSHLVVHHVPDFANLPYARYFANVVVVSGEAAEMSGKDLYRVLRPCGGVMFFVDAATPGASENRLRRGGQAHFAPKTPQNEPVPDGFRIGS